MATYFIFPEKDTTIYSHPLKTSLNTGLDEVLEINKELYNGIYYNSRVLLKFSQSDIATVLNKTSEIFSASLELFSTEHKELGFTQVLEVYPLSESWENGRGKATYSPQSTEGVSWLYRDGVTLWNTTGSTYLTSSVSSSQTFNFAEDLDTNLDITSMVSLWSSSLIDNHGLVVKRSFVQESGSIKHGNLQYFSRETHTIYTPKLKIQWDDSTYNTGSLTVLNSGSMVIQLKETPSVITQGNVQRFKLYVRPKFPPRNLQTSSLVSKNYALPSSSYYSVVDYKTGDILVDFNEFSKISCNSSGMYFDLDTTGFQPELYYKLLFKINNSEGTKTIDDGYIFKIVR